MAVLRFRAAMEMTNMGGPNVIPPNAWVEEEMNPPT
jgi:hypothetical protein